MSTNFQTKALLDLTENIFSGNRFSWKTFFLGEAEIVNYFSCVRSLTKKKIGERREMEMKGGG